MERYISPAEKERIRKVMATTAGRRMLEKTAKSVSTRLLYARGVLLFKEYLQKGLDEIVDEYKRDVKANMYEAFGKWEMIFEDFAVWLEKRGKGQTPATYFQGAKNLINANVPKSAELKVKGPKRRSRKIPPITIEDLRKIRKVTDEREGAFIDLLKDSGISRDDAVELNYKHVKKAVEDPNVQYLPISMYRAKEDVEYTAWIGPNAVESLRLYFEMRKRRGEVITGETPIFASNMEPYKRLNPRGLSQVLKRLEQKTGVAISTHKLRKFFETYISAGGVHPVTAKVWMGHKVGGGDVEARYIIPPLNLQREQYMKAYAYIDLRETKESEELLFAEIKARLESMPPMARRKYAKELKAIYGLRRMEPMLARPDIEELLKATKADGGMFYESEHCQRIVSEEELPALLAKGWCVSAVLPSGRVVVSKETLF